MAHNICLVSYNIKYNDLFYDKFIQVNDNINTITYLLIQFVNFNMDDGLLPVIHGLYLLPVALTALLS